MWIDPVKYVKQWLCQPVPVPDQGEAHYAMIAMRALGSLLYSNPTLELYSKRDRFYHVRKHLRSLSGMLERGFVDLTMELNNIGIEFLRRFRIEDSTISFDSTGLEASPIYSAIKRLECQNADPSYLETNHLLIRWVYSWHVFLAKTPLNRPDLEDSAKKAWIDRQAEVRERSFNLSGDLLNLRTLVAWIIDVDDLPLPGRHGPGTTANREKTTAGKNAVFRHSIQSSQLTPFSAVPDVRDFLSSPPPSLWMSVKKDCKSLRPITAEDAAMQYSQQALKMIWYLTNDFSREMPIRRFVRYVDQTRSQARAIRGSSFNRDDSTPVTIDLSSASDYLSVDLVSELFSGQLLHKVMSGRSWGSKVDKTVVEVGMYAGMGSALTFPVQTTIFACMAIYSTLIALYRRDNGSVPFNFDEAKFDYLCGDGFRPQYKKYEASIQVYGDDIIVPELAAPDLFRILERFGLRVNYDKSFVGSAGVRESCGIFALGGRDITPLRFRVPSFHKDGLLDFAAYEGLRSLINRSFLYGYGELYRYLISELRQHGLLLSNKEYKRVGSVIGKVASDVSFFDYMLFEAYRGDTDYLGIISSRDSKFTHRVRSRFSRKTVAVDSSAAFGVTSRAEVDSDSSSDFYHLFRTYLDMTLEDYKASLASLDRFEAVERGHGKIPRGIRLSIRSAIPRSISLHGRSFMAWGWAPR